MYPRGQLLLSGVLLFACVSCNERSIVTPTFRLGNRLASTTSASVGTVDVGDLGNNLVTMATDVNDSGIVVGISHTESFLEHGFVLSRGVMTDISPQRFFSHAEAISRTGHIAGNVGDDGSTTHAALWRDSILVDLGTLGGSNATALGLNASDEVVGLSQTAAGDQHAFMYQNGTMRDLGTLGGSASFAGAINDAGDVVGSAHDATGAQHAVEWHQGVIIDLGTLPGDVQSVAVDINSVGDVIGESLGADGTERPVEWHNGQISELTPLTDGAPSRAIGINDADQIVGVSGSTPIIWQDGVPTDLGLPTGATRAEAVRISDTGLIVGTAYMQSGPPWTEGIVWVLPNTVSIRGGAHHIGSPRGPGPGSPAATHASPQYTTVCYFSQIPVGYWIYEIRNDPFGCPLPNPLFAPNSYRILDLARVRVGEYRWVCGVLQKDAKGVISKFPQDLVAGRDDSSFVDHTPGQVWRVDRAMTLLPPSPLIPNNGMTDACNMFFGLFDFYSAGGPYAITRVQ